MALIVKPFLYLCVEACRCIPTAIRLAGVKKIRRKELSRILLRLLSLYPALRQEFLCPLSVLPFLCLSTSSSCSFSSSGLPVYGGGGPRGGGGSSYGGSDPPAGDAIQINRLATCHTILH
jgi:hypothetical protein